MKKFLYSQYDKEAQFFNHVQMSEIEPKEFAENIRRSIVLSRDPNAIRAVANCKLVELGTFDDETGKFDILKKPVEIFDCQKFISKRIEEDERNRKSKK